MMGLTPLSLLGSWVATYAIIFAHFVGTDHCHHSRKHLSTVEQVFHLAHLLPLWPQFDDVLIPVRCCGCKWLPVTRANSLSWFLPESRHSFNSRKDGDYLGVVLFFCGYFPFFAVSDDTATGSAKLAACLLSPTAFGLVINLAGTYEDAGSGVQWGNLQDSTANGNNTGNFTMAAGELGCTAHRVHLVRRKMNYCWDLRSSLTGRTINIADYSDGRLFVLFRVEDAVGEDAVGAFCFTCAARWIIAETCALR